MEVVMPRVYRTIGAALLLVLIAACSQNKPESTPAEEGGEKKLADLFIYNVKSPELPPEIMARLDEARKSGDYTVEATRLFNLDSTRAEGAPYLDFVWFWKGSANIYAEQEHVHPFDEFIGFIGTAGGAEDPYDLGGEMEVWLGGEKYTITKSCLIYIPKGLKHCPIQYTRIDSPILFFSGGMATEYSMTPTEFTKEKSGERNYAKNISYGVNPDKVSPEAVKYWEELHEKIESTVKSTRLLDLDSVEGAPYVDFVWLWEGSEKGPNHEEHSHDWGEVFGFVGTLGPENPRELGGEIEFWLDGEKNLITKSCLVYVPPGMKHCPIQFNRIDSPILLFTIGMTREYTRQSAGN
jgi:mannose-6-phosphate isomerase-like protein (cupin superfamily)